MSEREKEIIKSVASALPHMSDMDKGYFLGYAEALASSSKKEDESEYFHNELKKNKI